MIKDVNHRQIATKVTGCTIFFRTSLRHFSVHPEELRNNIFGGKGGGEGERVVEI